ncbi:MAG: ImmA/IrrE family metallo-endopeptidase [Gammaproteobacteria bacterium]
MRGIIAPVAPRALEYARNASGRTLGEIEERFPDICKWEAGGDCPLAEAKELAKFYHRSLTFLYLRQIPQDVRELDREPDDFRRTNYDKKLSPNFRVLLRQTCERQEWAREFLEESPESGGLKKPPGFGKRPTNAEVLGANIRNWLGIDGDELAKMDTPQKVLEYWQQLAGKTGIIVMQSGRRKIRIPSDEFSGCVIGDDIAPVVVLNSGDMEVRRIFTLVHEIAHLWIGKSGMHDADSQSYAFSGGDEEYCNRAAAAALMPHENFRAKWNTTLGNTRQKISIIAEYYKVSRSAVAVRAASMQLITRGKSSELRGECLRDDKGGNKQKARRKSNSHQLAFAETESAPVPRRKQEKPKKPSGKPELERFGRYFATLTLDAYEQGAISALDVGALVDIKLDALSSMAEQLNFPLHRWGR